MALAPTNGGELEQHSSRMTDNFGFENLVPDGFENDEAFWAHVLAIPKRATDIFPYQSCWSRAKSVIKTPRDKTGTSIRASALTLTGTALNRCRRVKKSPRERLKTIPDVGSEKLITLTFWPCRTSSGKISNVLPPTLAHMFVLEVKGQYTIMAITRSFYCTCIRITYLGEGRNIFHPYPGFGRWSVMANSCMY